MSERVLGPAIQREEMLFGDAVKLLDKFSGNYFYAAETPDEVKIERESNGIKLTLRWICGSVRVTFHNDGFVEMSYTHFNVDAKGKMLNPNTIRALVGFTDIVEGEFEDRMHTQFP